MVCGPKASTASAKWWFLFSNFIGGYGVSTVMVYFLLYSKVNKTYIYIYLPPFSDSPPICGHRHLLRVISVLFLTMSYFSEPKIFRFSYYFPAGQCTNVALQCHLGSHTRGPGLITLGTHHQPTIVKEFWIQMNPASTRNYFKYKSRRPPIPQSVILSHHFECCLQQIMFTLH